MSCTQSLPGQEHGTLNKHMANPEPERQDEPTLYCQHTRRRLACNNQTPRQARRTSGSRPHGAPHMPCPPGQPKNWLSSTRIPTDRRALSGPVTQGCKTVSPRLLPVVLHQPRENRCTRAYARLEYRGSKRRKHQFGHIYHFPEFPNLFRFFSPKPHSHDE